jgi:hypothetical protein
VKTPPYTQFTLKLYREWGVILDKVEFWNSFAHKRKDLFGCIDIVGLTPRNRIIGIQSTSGGCHSAHRKKILAEPRILRWLECGGMFHLVSWTKVKNRWKPRVERITETMYGEV